MASLSTPFAYFSPLSLLSPPITYSFSPIPYPLGTPLTTAPRPGQPTLGSRTLPIPAPSSESSQRTIFSEMQAIERARALQSSIPLEVQIIESSSTYPSVDIQETIEPPRIIPPLKIKGRYVCNVEEDCRESFTKRYVLKEHLLGKHGQEALKLRPDLKFKVTKVGKLFACPDQTCKAGYNRSSDLRKHMFRVHGDPGGIKDKKIKAFPCPHEDCKSGLSSLKALKKHLKDIHKEVFAPTKEIHQQIFSCDHQDCRLSFKEGHELKTHLWDVHRDILTTKTVVDQFKKHVV